MLASFPKTLLPFYLLLIQLFLPTSITSILPFPKYHGLTEHPLRILSKREPLVWLGLLLGLPFGWEI